MKRVGILGVGRALPDKVVTNHDIVAMGLDTSDEWITERVGIRERRISDEATSTSDLAVEAAKEAIKAAGVLPEEIDLVLVATSTPDYPLFPSTACLVQKSLGLKNIGAFDLAAACSGFNYALNTAQGFILSGQCKYVLVIAADTLSKYVDWTDRSICPLFGDGAGAAICGEVDGERGFIFNKLFSDGAQEDALKVFHGGSRSPFKQASFSINDHKIKMNGKAVFKYVGATVVPSVKEALQQAGIRQEDLDLVVFHQANLRIIDYAKQKLNFDDEQLIITIHKYGNTSAASIPISLCEAVEQGRLKNGSPILLVGFGAGFTWGINIL